VGKPLRPHLGRFVRPARRTRGEIAEALRVTLSPDEKARVETKPTENSEAYFFICGRTKLRATRYLAGGFEESEQFYLQAITLDPNFALAHARLASTRAQIITITAARQLKSKSAGRS